MKNIKIAVAYHKAAEYARNEMFIPIHVGAARADRELGIQKDSDGENISQYNPYCCELSATYYLWKNITDADYYGLCHYRRFFTFEKSPARLRLVPRLVYLGSKVVSPFVVDSRFTMSESADIAVGEGELEARLAAFASDLQAYLEQRPTDCFCLKPTKMSTYSCKTKLMKAVGLYNYNKLEEIIKSDHPGFYPYFLKTMRSNEYNPCNMLIARRDIFNEYATLLFSIIGKYHDWITLSADGAVNNAALRSSGYMGEFITSAFIMQLRDRNKTVKELNTMNVAIASTGLSQTTDGLITRIKALLFSRLTSVKGRG